MCVTEISKFVMQFRTFVEQSAWMAQVFCFLFVSSRRWHIWPWVSLRLLLSGRPVDLFVVWCCAQCGIRSSIHRSKASPMRNRPSATWDSRWHVKLNKILISSSRWSTSWWNTQSMFVWNNLLYFYFYIYVYFISIFIYFISIFMSMFTLFLFLYLCLLYFYLYLLYFYFYIYVYLKWLFLLIALRPNFREF